MIPPRVYLDHNAATFPYPEVLEEMAHVQRAYPGNPSSLHREGREARGRLDEAREKIASLLGALPTEILFTSGATEANNLALRGSRRPRTMGPRFLAVSSIEHPSVGTCARSLAADGHRVEFLPVDSSCRLKLDEFEACLARGPELVSVMAASNETGTLQPVEHVARRCREAGVLFHVDATQVFGRESFDLSRVPADYLSASGHKIHGPRGIGILVRRGRVPLSALFAGGHQELGFRPGTENVAAAAGFACALELVTRRLAERRVHLAELRLALLASLREVSPELILNGDSKETLPNTLNVRFPGLSAETLVLSLDLEGIAVSSGSACSSGAIEPSNTLLAMGLSKRAALSSLRLSLEEDLTPEELARTASAFRRVLERLRGRNVRT
ncbi:MAG: cysteine desulfurase [Planctomycetes bacterium]|nr:cysteine desulfurase [Planctomycetota bacterium]